MKKLLALITAVTTALLPLICRADPVYDPDVMKKFVGFVFVDTPHGMEANGTGFFISVNRPAGGWYIYFVTAKHVLTKSPESKEFLPTVSIRMSKRTGGFEHFWLPLTTNGYFRVYTHTDPGVDLAVVPLDDQVEKFDIRALPEMYLATKERMKKFKVREGDDMFFMGLFSPFYGVKANIPIFRFGRLAMLTEEKIPTGTADGDQFMYLMETHVFGGNSGSPVMFHFDERRNPNDTSMLIAGVMKGYFTHPSPIKIVEAKNQMGISTENTGVAVVTPAFLLDEIIQSEELKRLRAQDYKELPELQKEKPKP